MNWLGPVFQAAENRYAVWPMLEPLLGNFRCVFRCKHVPYNLLTALSPVVPAFLWLKLSQASGMLGSKGHLPYEVRFLGFSLVALHTAALICLCCIIWVCL